MFYQDGRLGLGERCPVLEVLQNGKPGLQIGFCEKGQEEKWRSEAEFKEFEPRLKFEMRLKYGWFHLKLQFNI